MLPGILFALIASLLSSLDIFLSKHITTSVSPKIHAILRIIFVIPILGIVSIFNWKLTKNAFPFLIIYGLLEAINIVCHQIAIKKGNPFQIELISKSKILLVLIVSILIGIDQLSIMASLAIILFTCGTILTINSSSNQTTNLFSLLFESVSVIARAFKPFMLKYCLVNEFISGETLAFLSMPIALLAILITIRKKDIQATSCIDIKNYIVLSIVISLGMLFGIWSIEYGNAVISNSISSLSVVFIIIISTLFFKRKYKVKTYIGSCIAVIGIVLACLL